jgi:hypothetical protein
MIGEAIILLDPLPISWCICWLCPCVAVYHTKRESFVGNTTSTIFCNYLLHLAQRIIFCVAHTLKPGETNIHMQVTML